MTSDSQNTESSHSPGPKLDFRARVALPVCVLLLAALALHRMVIADPAPPYLEFTGRTMGTTYSVKISEVEFTDAQRGWINREIASQLDRVNELMSTYDPTSELSRLNRHASLLPFKLSAETFEVIRIAQQISEMSGGAFDITVGPLVSAWGFGATDRPPESPSEVELASILERVGYRHLSLNPGESSISKLHPGTECDLSAIAKGYGVDRVAEALLAEGYENFLVEVGGELRANGSKPDSVPWKVGIERPDSEIRATERVIALRQMSLATSGDYRNYYEIDGVRISHTFDPRRNEPIRHSLASASVLHPRAVWADALATTINVLGPDAGFAWAEQHEIAALLIVRKEDGEFHSLETTAFRMQQGAP